MKALMSIMVAFSKIGEALTGFFGWLEGLNHKRLGELEERERNEKANADARAAIVAARDKRLSDDEAFGPR